jgi:5'-3' exonuclease
MVILRTIALYEFLDFFDWQVDVVFEFLDMLRILDSRITQVNRFTKELFFEERNLIGVDVVITDSQNQLHCLMVGDLCNQV